MGARKPRMSPSIDWMISDVGDVPLSPPLLRCIHRRIGIQSDGGESFIETFNLSIYPTAKQDSGFFAGILVEKDRYKLIAASFGFGGQSSDEPLYCAIAF